MTKDHVSKRSVVLHGRRKTSISLEDAFWEVLRQAATQKGVALRDLLMKIDEARVEGANLSSSIRLFVLDHVRTSKAA